MCQIFFYVQLWKSIYAQMSQLNLINISIQIKTNNSIQTDDKPNDSFNLVLVNQMSDRTFKTN